MEDILKKNENGRRPTSKKGKMTAKKFNKNGRRPHGRQPTKNGIQPKI